MIFGKIQYLNLLPFHVFMKAFLKNSSSKISMEYKRGVPSKINKDFHSRRVDAAFISSISAKKSKHVGLGIIAKRDVKSVIVIPSVNNKSDEESASSNVLANILNVEGQVLIGDKALHYALMNDEYIDLAAMWYKKYKLPFVFALLCYHKDKKIYQKIEKEFLKTKVKIPQYILQKASEDTEVSKKDILEYLKLISYKLDDRAKRGLTQFYKKA
ncbi:Menaquinone via 6-amino-6-deoxyfutalosine step 1 [hydrothermal vent metagenome]|uniref:Menaquinone via 6-amino-6-deoxyfutalosine step 1 n=1 Tax=hydrothermal vent metagenome TaxID=652676 RepID=A0A1W1BCE1_9ZZZZ